MTMKQRLISSASMTNTPKSNTKIISRIIKSTAMRIRKTTSTIINYFTFDEAEKIFDAEFTYDYFNSNGIMSEYQVSSATMKGR